MIDGRAQGVGFIFQNSRKIAPTCIFATDIKRGPWKPSAIGQIRHVADWFG